MNLIKSAIIYFSFVFTLTLFFSCEKTSDVLNINEDRFVSSQLNDISLSGSSNGVVVIPSFVNQVIKDVFNRYTAYIGSSGARVHILIQPGVSNDEAIKVRRILFWMLNDPKRTKNKLIVENTLSTQKATIAIFKSEIDRDAALNEKLSQTDLKITALTINEIILEGESKYLAQTDKDLVIERCALAVFQYGVFPAGHALLTEVSVWNTQLSTSGNLNFNDALFTYNNLNSAEQNAYLFGVLVDNYFNGWLNYPVNFSGNPKAQYPQGTSMAGALKVNGREDLNQRFPAIADRLKDFFGDYIEVPVSISNQFNGVFLMEQSNEKYTSQSKFLSQIAFTGQNANSVIGNEADNTFYGNNNVNYFTVKGGKDFVDGGENTDFVMFSGNKVEYNITNESGQIIITDLVSGRDSINVLKNVEFAVFNGEFFKLQ